MKSVIVTGGAGYIGGHACKALAQAGYLPVTYDNLVTGNRWSVRWGPLEFGDIRDVARLHQVFRDHAPSGVLHFAARALVGESVTEPALYYRDNVEGSIAVLEAARLHGVEAFVFSSTCAVYGIADSVPITESTPLNPINPYGASKLMVERVLADYGRAYNLRHIALRYFNAAGADAQAGIGEHREVETHLVPLAIEALLGRRPPLTILGQDYPTADGTAIRDYIHVADLALAHVRALDYLLEGGPSTVLNLGTGHGYSVQEVIGTISETAGRSVPTVAADRRAGDPPCLVASAERARRVLGDGLTARSDLQSIISTALQWHQSDFYRRQLESRQR